MFSRYCIERPIFAAVLSIVIVLAGLAALRTLPIAQYPEIAPPTVTISATFDVGTDIDKATFNVNNRVQLATPRLPEEVRRNGVVVAKRSANFLLVSALVSPNNSHDALFLSNYATLSVLDELKRIPGTAEVSLFGARDYAMRIWL